MSHQTYDIPDSIFGNLPAQEAWEERQRVGNFGFGDIIGGVAIDIPQPASIEEDPRYDAWVEVAHWVGAVGQTTII